MKNTSFQTAPPSSVIYVGTDGRGDYNCDGMDDQAEINQALQYITENPDFTTVYLKEGTYIIDDTIFIGSNTTLTGDPAAVLTIKSGAVWERGKTMIRQKDNNGNSGITICGFRIDGNSENTGTGIDTRSDIDPKPVVPIKSGQQYYGMISLKNCSDIKVHNMYMANNHSDALKLDRCSKVRFYNNFINQIGHDGLYANFSTDIEAYDNEVICRTNSALRLYQSDNARFYNNKISAKGKGGSGIEIQKYCDGYDMNNIEVFNNEIHDTELAGIWVFGGQGEYPLSSTFVHIHDNWIYNTGRRGSGNMVGGIVASGFNVKINNNTIDGCYDCGIAIRDNFYTAYGSGFEIAVNNNKITNTKSSQEAQTGYGVYIGEPDKYVVKIGNNDFGNNPGRDVY